ncbi:hypothetical protein WA026_001779 [Henosepilachna vigintioctopunctata]|uniref:Uncharacterized protein n=1 Tax=Henosepilachna vigintioctopunctata TaxID=420089 RepID=A0AAW1UVK0_9CUCU
MHGCEGVDVPSVDLNMITCVKPKKRALKTELSGVKKELGEIKNKKDNTVDSEEIISEIMDRSSRSYNVMIFNLPESGDPVLNTQIKHDKDNIANILSPVNLSDNEVVRVLRMGKRGAKKRPAKVVFSSPEAAKRALRS